MFAHPSKAAHSIPRGCPPQLMFYLSCGFLCKWVWTSLNDFQQHYSFIFCHLLFSLSFKAYTPAINSHAFQSSILIIPCFHLANFSPSELKGKLCDVIPTPILGSPSLPPSSFYIYHLSNNSCYCRWLGPAFLSPLKGSLLLPRPESLLSHSLQHCLADKQLKCSC